MKKKDLIKLALIGLTSTCCLIAQDSNDLNQALSMNRKSNNQNGSQKSYRNNNGKNSRMKNSNGSYKNNPNGRNGRRYDQNKGSCGSSCNGNNSCNGRNNCSGSDDASCGGSNGCNGSESSMNNSNQADKNEKKRSELSF